MNNTNTIRTRLSKVTTALKAPKSQYNSFGKYSYRSAEDIMEAVKPLLAENGLVMTVSDDIVAVGGRIYVKAIVTVMDVESDEQLVTTAFAREEETKKGMDGSQITGSASSYARKYALNGMFCIDDTKDADATNTHGQEAARKAPAPSLLSNKARAWKYFKKHHEAVGTPGNAPLADFYREYLEGRFNVKAEEVTDEQFKAVAEQFEKACLES